MYQGAVVAMRRQTEASAASWYGSERQNSRRGKHTPSLDAQAACTAELHYWWKVHFSCIGKVPALPVYVLLSFSPDQYELYIKGHPTGLAP